MFCPDCKIDIPDETAYHLCNGVEVPPATDPLDAPQIEDQPADDNSAEWSEQNTAPPDQTFVDQSQANNGVTNDAADITIEGNQIGHQTTTVERDQQVISVHGTQVKQKVINNYYADVRPDTKNTDQKSEEEAVFSQITEELYLRPATTCDFIIDEINSHFADLQKHNLILVGCPDIELALDAGHALVEKLCISDRHSKRRIDLWRHLDAGAIIGVKSFLPDAEQRKTKVAILVKAVHEFAENFLENLIFDSFRAGEFEAILRENDVYVLCIVQSRYIDDLRSDSVKGLKAPFWKIPFLGPLLKQHFENYTELEQRILIQRQKGLWKEDESDFCGEIKTLLKKGQLLSVINDRDNPKPDPVFPDQIFKDDDYIDRSILYAASYFRDVSPKEFCSLVESLLEGRKALMTMPEYKQGEGGAIELVQTRTEVSLTQFWKDNKDNFMWKWLSEAYSTKNAINVIEFSDNRLRDSLINFLGESRKFLLKDNFRTLQEQGFLFYPSNQMAENMIRLTCNMMSSYPDEFNKDWLVDLIVNTRNSFYAQRDSSTRTHSRVLQFLRQPFSGALALAYSRVSELMRQLLKDQQLKEVVAGTLADLIRLRYHDCVLNLVKRLRIIPEFDDFFWIKQLLDQGDTETRLLTYHYFHNRIKASNRSILDCYQFIEDWLPDEERPVGHYARSSTYALRSLIQHCLEAVEDLEPDSYGAWPSHYPLFDFQNSESAERGIGQLIRWLFQPAMTQTLQELDKDAGKGGKSARPDNLVGALIAEWYFILKGPDGKPGGSSDSEISADSLLSMLLKQVRIASDDWQRREMIKYWERLSEEMSIFIRSSRYYDMRTQFIWRKNRLWELASAIKRSL
jgi:hypothetical protein